MCFIYTALSSPVCCRTEKYFVASTLSPITPSSAASSFSPKPLAPGSSGIVGSEDSVPQNKVADVDDSLIDPQLLNEGRRLGQILVGCEDAEVSEDMETMVMNQLQEDPKVVSDLITATPGEFIRYFSKINITRNQSLASGQFLASRHLYSGNSREELTFFEEPCVNITFGCPKRYANRTIRRKHEVVCKITSHEAFVHLNQQREFKCDREGCSSAFGAKKNLMAHIRSGHDWQPRHCTEAGCDSSVLFTSYSLYNKHREKHTAYVPTKCTVPDCTSTITFQRQANYSRHLACSHRLSVEERTPYIRKRVATQVFVPHKCPVAGCKSTATWPYPGKLLSHLADKHGWDDVQGQTYLEEGRQRGWKS